MRKKCLHLFLFSFYVLPGTFFAQNFDWIKMNGPYGGKGLVAKGQDDKLLLISGRIIFVSSDGAQSWEAVPPHPASTGSSANFVEVGADLNLYARQNQNLFQSVDNGQTWALLHNNLNFINVTGLPGGVILISDGNAIRRSTDNGQTWSVAASGLSANSGFSVNPYNGDVYCWTANPSSGITNSLWRSQDQGLTWSVALMAQNLYIQQVVFSPNGAIYVSERDNLYRSLDDGASWTVLPLFFIDSGRNVTAAVSSTGRLFAHEWWQSKYSDDNGDTWHTLTDAGGNYLFNFQTDYDGRIYALADDFGSIHVSEDNGVTWRFAAHNIPNAFVKKLVHIDSARIAAQTYDGLFYSRDGGDTWSLIWGERNSTGIVFGGDNDQLCFCSDGTGFYFDGIGIVKIEEDGHVLNRIPTPVQNLYHEFEGLACSPFNPDVWLIASGGVYKYQVNNQTWQQESLPNHVRAIAFATDGSVVAFTTQGIWRYSSNSHLWTTVSPELLYWPQTTTAPDGAMIAVNTFAPLLYFSHDNGLTWEAVNPNQIALKSLAVNNAGHLFMRSEIQNRLMHSVDGGHTFNPTSLPAQGVPGSKNQAISINQATQHLYLSSVDNGVWRTVQPSTEIKLLSGKVWHDVDEDCVFVYPDSLVQGLMVKVTGNNETRYAISNNAGNFLTTVGRGQHQASIIVPSEYWESCDAFIHISDDDLTGIVDSVQIGMKANVYCPLPTVSVSAPFLRRCFESDVFVRFENKGTIPAFDAYLTIKLDSLLEYQGASLPLFEQNGHTYTFFLGDMEVRSAGGMTLTVTPSCDAPLGYIHCLKANIYPDAYCLQQNAPHIVTSAACAGDSIRLSIENAGNADMSAPLSWFLYPTYSNWPDEFTAEGTFFLNAGEVFTTTIFSDNPSLEFYARQAPEYPYNYFSHTTIKGCGGSPGSVPMSIATMDAAGPFTSRFCGQNIGAYDPNDKQGFPAGISNQGYIEEGQELIYLIRFQNTGTDTAFNVTIRDTLSHSINLGSIELLNSSHPCEMRLLPNGSLLFVFERIMLPDSNTNEPASHGFVSFRAAQNPGIPFGTKIRNAAAIYFDFNEPVFTNMTLHTVGIPFATNSAQRFQAPNALRAMPNPFRESLTLHLENGTQQPMHLVMLDAQGRIVLNQYSPSFPLELTRKNLPGGLYLLLVVDQNGRQIGSAKVIAY